MYNTKIDWADSSWNPVTGCMHGCEYCYAKAHVKRFGFHRLSDGGIHDLVEPFEADYGEQGIKTCPYPYDFDPTFHRYRLGQPSGWTKPRTIFVCSMADLFGDWVPDEWIQQVFEACANAPQHRYLFLTKNKERYLRLAEKGMLPRRHWYGYTATTEKDLWRFHHADECPATNLFVSIEPILAPIKPNFSTHCPADWVIVGAESGQRKGKVIPEREWVARIARECKYSGRPIFMKESLRQTMGADFRQEYPWEVFKP